MDTIPESIKVIGRIKLGVQLNLVRDLPPSQQISRHVINPGGANLVPDWRVPAPVPQSRIGVDRTDLVYSLIKEGSEVAIEDDGLCQSYCIFGVPGCGKTNLLMHLLRQITRLNSDQPGKKFGALLLDPKGALLADIQNVVAQAGREADLIVINDYLMTGDESRHLNVIDSFLEPDDLGKALALAAKSAGISSKEPYWLNDLGIAFGKGLEILSQLSRRYHRKPTLRHLAGLLLGIEDPDPSHRLTTLEGRLADAAAELRRSPNATQELEESYNLAREYLYDGYLNHKDYSIMASFARQAYGNFRLPKHRIFSAEYPPSSDRPNIYDSIVEDGKIILVSLSKRNLAVSRMLCTLIKVLFQQTVITRRERVVSRELTNFERPLLFLADEYSDVATQLQYEPLGDGTFFSQMRQFGCMGLVATQSLSMLKTSGLGETWENVYDTLVAKVFMTLGDAETAKAASDLAADKETLYQSFDRTTSKDGTSLSVKSDLRDRKTLPTQIPLQTLERGQAVVVGATDGKSRPSVRFVQVPRWQVS